MLSATTVTHVPAWMSMSRLGNKLIRHILPQLSVEVVRHPLPRCWHDKRYLLGALFEPPSDDAARLVLIAASCWLLDWTAEGLLFLVLFDRVEQCVSC